MCKRHCLQFESGEPFSPARISAYSDDSECEAYGCTDTPKARGFCTAHYNMWHANDGKMPELLDCPIEGCERKFYLNKFCHKCIEHYGRCTVTGCIYPSVSPRSKFCHMHAGRFYATGEVGPPHRLIAERTGKSTDRNGYLRVSDPTVPKRRLQEHRWVVEQYIGRQLTDEETVHHINGVRTDNRIENLELWSKSQPPGQRVLDKLQWARDIIALYGQDEDMLLEMPSSAISLDTHKVGDVEST